MADCRRAQSAGCWVRIHKGLQTCKCDSLRSAERLDRNSEFDVSSQQWPAGEGGGVTCGEVTMGTRGG